MQNGECGMAGAGWEKNFDRWGIKEVIRELREPPNSKIKNEKCHR